MRLAQGRGLLAASLFLLMGRIGFAQYEVGIPVPNWTVPPYGGARPASGLSTMTDISPGIAFVAMSPCRVFDTRNANGPYGGPRLLGNTTRNFDIDNGPCTGIPALPEAYSMNFGAILPDGANSFVTIWPTGSAQPVVSTINPIQGGVVANAAIVPAGTGGSISVFPNTGMHLYGDINGYFTDRYNADVSFHAVSSNAAPAILAENTSAGTNAVAVQAVITSASAGDFATAVYGRTNGNGYGVHGSSANGYGVLAGGGAGGVYATTDGAGSGVYGQHVPAGLAYGYGVYGFTSGSTGSAGVLGVGAGGRAGNPPSGYPAVPGVRGEARDGFGVLGLTVKTGNIQYSQGGVRGIVFDLSANQLASGYLGYASGGTHHGIVSQGSAVVTGDLTVGGNFSSANKFFVEPHPHDASKEIRYVSLEGPHAEVYFRGTAQVSRGITRIAIPEDFRFVADPATYSTLVTPIGGMATVAVMSQGDSGIVVQASRDVKIAYVVYAERAAIKNPNPIAENVHFRPMGDLDVFKSMPESYKRLLVQNGTLNPDGTANLETARRLGWEVSDKEGEPIARTSSE